MNHELLGLAFAAGLVAALNPCGFAMLAAYLAFVVSATEPSRPAAIARAVFATVMMTVGFLGVFALFGTLTVAVASTLQLYLPVVTVVVGAALIAIGIWLASGRQLRLPLPAAMSTGADASPTTRLGSMFGYGVAYAIASLSCTVGPFLAVTAAGARSNWPADALAVYLAYAAGFALIVGTLAVAAAFTCSALAVRLQKALPVINRVGGVLVVVAGVYVAYYGMYELRLFHTDAGPNDAVISAAGWFQGTLASWVNGHGGWPWLLTLVALLAGASAWAWRRKVRSRSIRP